MFGSAQLGVQDARTTMISVQPVFRGLPTQPQQSLLPTAQCKTAVASSSRSSPAKSPKPKPKPNYKCTYEGCDKSYSKPARLATHILSHTGEVSICSFKSQRADMSAPFPMPRMLSELSKSFTSCSSPIDASTGRGEDVGML